MNNGSTLNDVPTKIQKLLADFFAASDTQNTLNDDDEILDIVLTAQKPIHREEALPNTSSYVTISKYLYDITYGNKELVEFGKTILKKHGFDSDQEIMSQLESKPSLLLHEQFLFCIQKLSDKNLLNKDNITYIIQLERRHTKSSIWLSAIFDLLSQVQLLTQGNLEKMLQEDRSYLFDVQCYANCWALIPNNLMEQNVLDNILAIASNKTIDQSSTLREYITDELLPDYGMQNTHLLQIEKSAKESICYLIERYSHNIRKTNLNGAIRNCKHK